MRECERLEVIECERLEVNECERLEVNECERLEVIECAHYPRIAGQAACVYFKSATAAAADDLSSPRILFQNDTDVKPIRDG